MMALTHFLTGATVAQKLKNPAPIAGISFTSHFLLDSVPHNDYIYFYFGGDPYSIGIISSASVIIALFALFFVLKGKNWWKMGVFGAFFAALPDIITNTTYAFGLADFWFNRLHRATHLTDLGEVFYRLSGGVIEHTQDVEAWRANFELLNTSFPAQLGGWLELAFEILFIFFLFRYLKKTP